MGTRAPKPKANVADRLSELPTLPSIVYELSRVINNPMSSTADLEKVMKNDQSLTAKVLRLANSAFYAIPGGVSSLQRAIAYIGFDSIHQVVLSTSVINTLDVKLNDHFNVQEFWKHSVGVAIAAEVIAKHVHYKTPAEVFTCGLVHDMGKIAIYLLSPEDFVFGLTYAKEKGIGLHEVEETLGLPKHTQIGYLLASQWHLPPAMQATIRFHHQKEQSLRMGLSSEVNLVVDIVYLANLLTHALKFGNSGHNQVLGAPVPLLERMHLDSANVKGIIEKIRGEISKADDFLKVIGGKE